MKLVEFSVTGFKNFSETVTLKDLDKLCVIHGDNNIGKSNLLEAMGLFFDLLKKTITKLDIWDANYKILEKEIKLKELLENKEIFFNLKSKKHIALNSIFSEESNILLKINFLVTDSSVKIQIYSESLNIDELSQLIIKISALPFFNLVGTDRLISPSELDTVRCIIPQTLKLQLYDLRDALDQSYKKWELFIDTLAQLQDITGKGKFTAIFDRHNNCAELVFETENYRINVEQLGSGIQQIIALVARLVLSDADIIAIEEPELNLRHTLQLRLRDIFIYLLDHPLGPKQIFITSHSPAFEYGDHFYYLSAPQDAPILEKRSIQYAYQATGFNTPPAILSTPTNEPATVGYISTDGIVKVPDPVLQKLQLSKGGGVVFIERKDSGHIEMLTNDQFMGLFESNSDDD